MLAKMLRGRPHHHGRADQRPRPRHPAGARGGDRALPRLHDHRDPRPVLPEPRGDPHPRLRGRRRRGVAIVRFHHGDYESYKEWKKNRGEDIDKRKGAHRASTAREPHGVGGEAAEGHAGADRAGLDRARASLRATPDAALTDVQRSFRDEIDRFFAEHGPVALTRACLGPPDGLVPALEPRRLRISCITTASRALAPIRWSLRREGDTRRSRSARPRRAASSRTASPRRPWTSTSTPYPPDPASRNTSTSTSGTSLWPPRRPASPVRGVSCARVAHPR